MVVLDGRLATSTGWKRRASRRPSRCAGDTRRASWRRRSASSPRASAGLSMLEASIAPSALPAPTSVCISSMKRMTLAAGAVTSSSTDFKRSSNSPRYLAPAIMAPRSSAMQLLVGQALGHVAVDDVLYARPSAIAFLPTPGSPRRTGFGFRRREDLHAALHLVGAADEQVEQPVARALRQVGRALRQGGVLPLARAAAAADELEVALLDLARERGGVDAELADRGARGAVGRLVGEHLMPAGRAR